MPFVPTKAVRKLADELMPTGQMSGADIDARIDQAFNAPVAGLSEQEKAINSRIDGAFSAPMAVGGSRATLLQSEHDEDADPTVWETTKAALQRENLIGSAASSNTLWSGATNRVDPDFNVFDALKDEGVDIDALPDSLQERFLDVHNAKHMKALLADIEREQKNLDTLERSGWTGVALSMAATIADPTILIPGGAMVKGGTVGYSVGKTAARVGLMAGVGAAAQETGLQLTQETRPISESALNIAGATILGGLLGGGVAKYMTRAEWKTISQGIELDLTEAVLNPKEVSEVIVSRMQSAGAASVDQIDISDLGVGGPRAAQVVANTTSSLRINPGVQTMLSPSVKTREIYNKMVDNPIYTTMNMDGNTLGPSAENMMKKYQRGALASWIREKNSLYKQARKAGENIKRDEFDRRIGRAMRRGDVDPDSEFVTKAAQAARAKITDPLLREAQGVNLLPDDVQTTTAQSYFSRMWNREKLIADEGRFRQIARDYIAREIAALPQEKGPDFVSKADMEGYVNDVVDSIFNNLTGRGSDNIPEWLVPIQRGPLKERTFKIPDELIEDFLEDQAELVLGRHTRTMAAEVELARKFDRPDMTAQLDEIRQDYKDLREKTRNDKSLSSADRAKEIKRLDTYEKRDIANIEAFRDLLRGTYRVDEQASIAGRMTRMALAWNYVRLLGGVTLTSMADTARLVGVHGVRATMREGLPNLIKTVRGISLSVNEAKELGAVTEMVLNSRLATLAELTDPYAHGSKFERMMDNLTTGFSKATGLPWWNDTMKGISSIMTQNRILRNVGKPYGDLDKFDRAYMGFIGIDENMAGRINRQFKKYGGKDGSALVANTQAWDDKIAADTYAAALNKDVDRTIVTKGVADQPLWTRSNVGKLFFQFKSFALASHQRVLIAGLQERPHRLAEMMVFGTAIGMMIAYLKHVERGDMEKANALLDNPGLWVTDGLDRTGILALPFEASNTLDKLNMDQAFGSGVPLTIKGVAQTVAGDKRRDLDVSRYSSRGKFGAIGGPSVGLFEDLTTIAEQLSDGDLKKSGANAIVRQIPGGSLPGVKTGLYTGVRPALQELVD